jgi:hypothetical protein
MNPRGASKSAQNCKFLGLELVRENWELMTEARVKSWVWQIEGEGIPIM